MRENEFGYVPEEESQGDVVNTENVESLPELEITDPTETKDRHGIFKKINAFLTKHPNITRSLFTLEVLSVLGLESAKILRTELPQVNYAYTEKVSSDAQQLIKVLENDVGYLNTALVSLPYSLKRPDERSEVVNLPSKTRINGFEKFKLSNEQVKNILQKTLPKGFVRNINSFAYADLSIFMPMQYGEKLVHSKEAGHAEYFGKRIEIGGGAKNSSIDWIANNLILHETFHLQDWNSNSLLTYEERLELYKTIIDRVKSPDRFKSTYVESISNEDKQAELSAKAGEYFAEIGATYLSGDVNLLPKEDRLLVENFIAKFDPEFNRVEALKVRDRIIGLETPFGEDAETLKNRQAEIEKLAQAYVNDVVKITREKYKNEMNADIEQQIENAKERLYNDAVKFYKEYDESIKADKAKRFAERYK
jgi:hypothetical protein